MLIAAAENTTNNHGMTAEAIMTNERILLQLRELEIDVRRITQQHQENFLQKNNNLTLLIVDQSSYLTVELGDDTEKTAEEEEDSIELATYSNSDATVFAYISISENLWMRTP
jgi:hypothetical protein